MDTDPIPTGEEKDGGHKEREKKKREEARTAWARKGEGFDRCKSKMRLS